MDSVFLATLQAAPEQPSLLVSFMPMIIIFGIFYVLVIAPSRKKQMEQDKLLGALKVGDKVILSSGIFGSIVGLDEKVVTVRVSDNAKIRVLRSAVAGLEEPAEASKT